MDISRALRIAKFLEQPSHLFGFDKRGGIRTNAHRTDFCTACIHWFSSRYLCRLFRSDTICSQALLCELLQLHKSHAEPVALFQFFFQKLCHQ